MYPLAHHTAPLWDRVGDDDDDDDDDDDQAVVPRGDLPDTDSGQLYGIVHKR